MLKKESNLAVCINVIHGKEQTIVNKCWTVAKRHLDNELLPACALLTLITTWKTSTAKRVVPRSNLKPIATTLLSAFDAYGANSDLQQLSWNLHNDALCALEELPIIFQA